MKRIVSLSVSILLLIGCSKEKNPIVVEELEQNNAPQAFNLLTPVEGIDLDVYNITFTWEDAEDLDDDDITYELYVYDSDASPIRIAENLTKTSYTIEGRYDFDSNKTWYVTASDGKQGGETKSSEKVFVTRSIQAEEVLDGDSGFSYPSRTRYTSMYFNETFFIINGYGESNYLGDVWSSRNYGAEWALESDLTDIGFQRYGHSSTIFNDKMWVIGGYYDSQPLNEVYSSTDGITWSEEPFAGSFMHRYDHTSVVFNNKMWIIGGHDNDAFVDNVLSWTGDPEASWVLEADAAQTPFDGIRGHSSVVFDNQIWVIGGIDKQDYQDTVWVTSDGITWTSGTPFPEKLAYHKSVVFDDKVWVIGGATKAEALNSVFYYDKDTGQWVQYEMPAEFNERKGYGAIVVDEGTPDDGIYILGSNTSGDVWKLY